MFVFGQSIMLDTIDHMLVNAFKEWLLTEKEYLEMPLNVNKQIKS